MKYLALVLMLVATPSIAAADPTPAPIIIPDGPTPPTPPPPTPCTTLKLASDQLMIVRANIDVVVLTSPAGLVKVTKDAGPVKVKAKFTDGDGTYQCRTFTDKWVYSLEATGSGTAELLVVNPADGSVVRRTLELNGPTPPPPPPPPPNPTDPLVAALQAAYVVDTDPNKATNVPLLAGILPRIVDNAKAAGGLIKISELEAYSKGYVDKVLGTSTLPAVRKAGSLYVASKLPTVDGPLTDAVYVSAAAAFSDVGKALGNVRRGK